MRVHGLRPHDQQVKRAQRFLALELHNVARRPRGWALAVAMLLELELEREVERLELLRACARAASSLW